MTKKSMPKSITIDGVEYVPATEYRKEAEKMNGLPYVIVRCTSAGVFAGYLKERDGQEATVLNARRLWYWSGAASLSQLSQEGVKKPDECKFPCEVPKIGLTDVVEVIDCSQEAKESIASVPIWKM